jgi:outer membrane protein OmpA-like peptidoglycan-associated protein
MRSLFVSAAALVIAAAPAAAQKAGTVEIGAFGRVTWFDNAYQLQNSPGFGGRLGIFPLRNLEIEGQYSYIPTHSTDSVTAAFDEAVSVQTARGYLEYNINFRPMALIIGAGVAYSGYGGYYDSIPGHTDGIAPSGLIGLRFGVGGILQGRIDGTYDYVSSPAEFSGPPDNASNWGLQAGLSLVFPKEKPKDSDKDGVIDKLDACPNTPLGTKVDDKGCPIPLDDDKDGVVNDRDQCPNTPAGETVNAVGCSASQLDDDRDGVNNALDKCPNTPAGTKVNAQGCPEDDDKDGVVNSADKCPNTPAGEKVDAMGCSDCQRDSDGDGVMDCKDRCPSTNAGNKVDAVGCRIIFEETGGTFIIKGSSFVSGSSKLGKQAKISLTDAAIKINTILPSLPPDYKIWVQGHTDSTGSVKLNERLSQARAESVKAYLITQGVPADRLEAKGYASTRPIADNKTKAGREANRRVSLYGGPTELENPGQ